MSALSPNSQSARPNPALIRRLDHVAIAVRDTDEALRQFSNRLGLSVIHVDELDTPPVTLTYLDAGNILIQLLAPREECDVSRWLDEHGEGMHHLCFAVDDVAHAVEILSSEAPSPELGQGRGRASGFVNDGSPHGVLIECTLFDPGDGPSIPKGK